MTSAHWPGDPTYEARAFVGDWNARRAAEVDQEAEEGAELAARVAWSTRRPPVTPPKEKASPAPLEQLENEDPSQEAPSAAESRAAIAALLSKETA